MTPRQLFDWAKENIKGINFAYATAKDYRKEEAFLSERFKTVRTLSGTQKLHCIVPKNTTTVLSKFYSNEVAFREFSLLKSNFVPLTLKTLQVLLHVNIKTIGR